MIDAPVAIVTGASRGIGRAIAEGLAADGYKTILMARSKDALKRVAFEIVLKLGLEKALTPDLCALDVTDEATVQSTLKHIVETYGRIDVLVNNAGQWLDGSLDASTDQVRTLFEVNLLAPYLLLRAVVPLMKERGSGYLFNVASRAGTVGFPESGTYCASKFALVGLSDSLHRELAPMGIKVTAICPGWVNTDMAIEAGTSLAAGDMIQPADIAQTIHYLLHLSPSVCIKDIVLGSHLSVV